jgi:hypothetical protein
MEDLFVSFHPYAMRMNPWRVLEKIARHDGGRFSNSRGLSAHIPLRFEAMSTFAIARRERNGCDCLSLAKVTRAPEENAIGKEIEKADTSFRIRAKVYYMRDRDSVLITINQRTLHLVPHQGDVEVIALGVLHVMIRLATVEQR